ncbi:MAG: hypothetical protein AABZ47_04465 [Planctomycetota bacterium]
MTRIRPSLEFTARVRDQEQKSKVGSGDQKSSETIFEENLRLETKGSVYHPNLLDFSLAGLFGLTQQHFEEDLAGRNRSFREDGDILEFDFEGHFLKKKPYPGTVFARRYRALKPRPFLSSLETTTTNEGFIWQWVDPKTPTSLQFNHTDVLLDPLDPEEAQGRQTNTNLRFETAYRFTEHNALSFTYNRQSVSEEPFAVDYDSDEATLAHRLEFGDRYQYRLDSEINFFDQRGTFGNRRTRWRESLRLDHTESLRSRYEFEFLDRTQGNLAGVAPIQEQSLLLSGTLEHEWYESLVSRLYGFAQRQDFDSGLDIERLGVQPGFDYRKKNPWGTLLAAYRYRIQNEDRQGGSLSAEVTDESRTFRDPEPVVLTNTNVETPSLFITAQDRTTIYRDGADFRLRRVGDTIEIERVPTGRIRDGETVLIDYVFVIGGGFTLDTTGHDFDLRQNFSFGLSPYYRLRQQDQQISPADAMGVTPEDITAHTIGTEYNRGPLRAMAEFEDHDSNVNPFEALRLSAELTHRFESGGTARLKARWSDIERFGEISRETQFFTVEGRYRHTIANHLTLEGAVLHRTEKDSVGGDDRGLDVDLSLEWIVRDTELRVTYETGRFEDDFAENRNSALFVQFRRRF